MTRHQIAAHVTAYRRPIDWPWLALLVVGSGACLGVMVWGWLP